MASLLTQPGPSLSSIGASPLSIDGRLGARIEIELSELRWPAAAMLAAGAVLPLLGHPGIACPLRTLTGIPCPLCGMSTSVEDTVRGHFHGALRANPPGIAAVLIAAVVFFTAKPAVVRLHRWMIYAVLASM